MSSANTPNGGARVYVTYALMIAALWLILGRVLNVYPPSLVAWGITGVLGAATARARLRRGPVAAPSVALASGSTLIAAALLASHAGFAWDVYSGLYEYGWSYPAFLEGLVPALVLDGVIGAAGGMVAAYVLRDADAERSGMPVGLVDGGSLADAQDELAADLSQLESCNESSGRAAGVGQLFGGLALAGIGAAISAVSYNAGGSTFIIATGPIVGGALMVLRGSFRAVFGR